MTHTISGAGGGAPPTAFAKPPGPASTIARASSAASIISSCRIGIATRSPARPSPSSCPTSHGTIWNSPAAHLATWTLLAHDKEKATDSENHSLRSAQRPGNHFSRFRFAHHRPENPLRQRRAGDSPSANFPPTTSIPALSHRHRQLRYKLTDKINPADNPSTTPLVDYIHDRFPSDERIDHGGHARRRCPARARKDPVASAACPSCTSSFPPISVAVRRRQPRLLLHLGQYRRRPGRHRHRPARAEV